MEQKPPVDDYVLYADDDQDDKDFLTDSFNKYASDKTLETVSTGLELLDYLKQNVSKKGLPCLIILDQNMPRLTGDRTLIELKADPQFATIPVVMFTTSNRFDINVLKLHDTPSIIKPVNYKAWEDIALKLLKYCRDFKEGAENK